MRIKLKAHDGADIVIEIDDIGDMSIEMETYEGYVNFWIPKDGVLELKKFISENIEDEKNN